MIMSDNRQLRIFFYVLSFDFIFFEMNDNVTKIYIIMANERVIVPHVKYKLWHLYNCRYS